MSNFELTDKQIAIIEAEEWTSAVITASAGSGKTTTIIRRAINQVGTFVEDEPWKNIAIISFTNKSADDIKKKVQELRGHNHNIVTMTFHAFLIRHILSFIRLFRGKNIGFDYSTRVNSLEKWVNCIKDNEKIPISENSFEDYVFKASLKVLKSRLYVRKYLKNKFIAIYIDEAQDNNSIQYKIVDELLKIGIQIVMVGDSNQMIYGFRGANAHQFIKLKDDNRFPNRYSLNQNFRCHELINEFAISHQIPNESKYDKKTKQGVFVCSNNKLLNKVIPYFEEQKEHGLCFLFRGINGQNNVANRRLIEKLELPLISQPSILASSSSPYFLNQLFIMYFGGYREELDFIDNVFPEIKHKTAKSLISDLKSNPTIENLARLNDYVGEYPSNDFKEIIDTFHSSEAKQFYKLDTSKNFAMTIHSAKGLEFKNVVLMCHDFHDLRSEDNKNLFYVACTRAKKRLFFLKL